MGKIKKPYQAPETESKITGEPSSPVDNKQEFDNAVEYVLKKNKELYERLS
ncbi:MAG: hypothetical protein N5P05_001873 [Chroococcopsis gigantea SAG 12.99]|jgi:hypothetical protein|nr:hypothetical protein [Chroococcopsis gigantea SAG 12.99]